MKGEQSFQIEMEYLVDVKKVMHASFDEGGRYALGRSVSDSYARQLFAGVSYIHSVGICHLDIKPSNLGISERGNLKLMDFGLASFFLKGETMEGTTEVCSPLWRPPEVWRKEKYDPFLVDVWSCGVCSIEFFTGENPFEDKSLPEAIFLFNAIPYLERVSHKLKLALPSCLSCKEGRISSQSVFQMLA